MITASVMVGSSAPGCMLITPLWGMLKRMRSGPPELGVLLAAVMASRREHPASQVLLASEVLVTVKVVAAWAGPLDPTNTKPTTMRAATISPAAALTALLLLMLFG